MSDYRTISVRLKTVERIITLLAILMIASLLLGQHAHAHPLDNQMPITFNQICITVGTDASCKHFQGTITSYIDNKGRRTLSIFMPKQQVPPVLFIPKAIPITGVELIPWPPPVKKFSL